MELKRNEALVLITFIVVSGVVIVLLNSSTAEQYETIEAEWGVEIGDEFTYLLNVTGGVYSGHNQQTGPPEYAELNGSIIRFQIVSLPEIPTRANNDSFLNDVIFPIKVTCEFDNSSEVPEPVNSRLCELISWTLLPIGDWHSINTLYNRSFYHDWLIQGIYGEKMCYTKMNSDSFNLSIIHQKDWMHAIAERWRGSIDMTTGLAYSAMYSDYSFSCIGSGESLYLSLSLVP